MVREQNLYQILKLTGKFIIDNNLNIPSYSLKQASQDGNIVSVGDNILFECIRRYRGEKRDYKEIFKTVSKLRASLNRAKKEGSQTEIRMANAFISKLLFVNDVINVEYNSKSEHKKIAKAGFYLNGIRYVRFSAGAGQLRRQTVTFINAELEEPMTKILMCGIDEKVSEINLAKLSAYFALSTSSVLWVDTPKCCIIKDFDTIIKDQKVDWIYKDENGEGYVKERIMDVELNSADGQGLIDPKWAAHWGENMGLDYVPSSFVVRSCFVKGNLVPFDFKEYARRNGITKIKDRYGTEYDVENIDCLLSESQFKMYKYYKNWEEYLEYFNRNNLKWGVARYNKKVDPEFSLVNYQYIQVLSLSDEEIKDMIQPTIDWLNKVCTGDDLYALLYCFGGFGIDQDISYSDVYTRAQNLAMKAVVKNSKFLKDSYVQRKIYKNIVEAINKCKIGKIWIRGNYQFCISDPIAQCRSALGLGTDGEIPADNVYCNFWNDRGVDGMVDICRSPMIDKHEHNPCNIYRSDEADYWYQYIRSGVIFSIYDTSVCRMEDSDFDGDIVLTTDNKYFVKGCDKQGTNVIMYDKPSAPLKKITHSNLVDSDCKGFGNKVGVYSNHATVLEAMRGLFTKEDNKTQIDEINLRKKLLREIIGAEIDSTKGLEKPKEPRRFTQKVKFDEDDSQEERKAKYIHNSLVISKKPYFFRYLYPELNQKYKKYEAAYNEISKCEFRTKFKKLLVKENKTDAEKSLIRRYHKFSPLINTNCTMNIMCRKFEETDFDIQYNKDCVSMLPYYDLENYNIDQNILFKFRKMYQKYSNKKIVSYINYIYEGCDDSEFKEIRFSAIDEIKNELKEELDSMDMPIMDVLTYIKSLSLTYNTFNWAFAWDILDDSILEIIDEDDALAPVEDPYGQEYLGRYYSLRKISKAEKNYTINEETGEVTFYDNEGNN